MINAINLTQDLIRCKSVTPENDGAQDILINVLKDMGFEIYDLPFDGNGSYPVKNFFARLGTKAPHICYAGHTDVVPAGDESLWSHPPFDAVIDGDIMYGRGTSDMKGGNAAFTAAVSNFLEDKKNFQGSISFLITGDEEADAINGTVRVLEWMKENNHIPDVCLVGESSNIKELGEEIKIGRRGSLSGELIIRGTQGHVAYPQFADNPIPRLTAMACALSNYQFDEGTKNFPPTNLEISTIDVGNTAGNVIPSSGYLKFNIRFNTTWTRESLSEKIHEILESVHSEYELELSGNAEPFLTDAGDWINLVSDIVKTHTNKTPKLSTAGGTSDARFIAKYCPVLEFGLTNETIHQIDECLKISDLEKLVEIYTDILKDYLK
ncbi:MAG: succinyl-diaminopimelate desuccinylase [Pseudomonadota bacterium]